MAKKKPDHRDADLVLRLYDLRRESLMRQSRAAIAPWVPRAWEDLAAVLETSHPLNAAWRQVSSYFEMAYGFARHGIVPADFLAENTGEGLLLFAKVEPHLERLRAEVAPTAFQNAEWLVKKSSVARKRLAIQKKRVEAMRAKAETEAAGRVA